MSNWNKVTLQGRLGANPELRTMPDGRAVANFRLATSERWPDKTTGEQRERTEWHNCVVFGSQAEVVSQYVEKGHLLMLEGSLRTRKWEDKEGKDRYTTEIIVSKFDLQDNRPRTGDSDNRDHEATRKPVSKAKPAVDDFDDDF